ncbi:MAG: hypothetical protein MnENMB40S_16400 [Rhizobiaceae bacterium MnEN-MB40S]|nr:MAG: hypothetical protein MnENMB40S_16400 [Rhizobiaceae bacterium MnEN-MB40S]
MLDLGWQEFIVVALVLVLIVGPKDLPEMLRTFGKTTKKLRGMAGDFRKQFDDALKEAELDDVSSMISDARKFNPRNALKDVIDPLESAGRDIKAGLNEAAKATGPTPSVAKTANTEKVTEKTQSAEPKAAETSKKTTAAAAKKPATRKPAARKTAASGKAASTTTKSTTTKSASAKSASTKSKSAGAATAKSGSTKAASSTAKSRAKTGAGSAKSEAPAKPAAGKTRKTTTRTKSAASKSKAATADSASGEKA